MVLLYKRLARLLRDSNLLGSLELVSDPGRLLCFRIKNRNVGNVDGFFHFDELTRSSSLLLDRLLDDIDTLYKNSLFLKENGDDLPLLPLVLSGDYLYEISAVNFHKCDIRVLLVRER